MGRSEVYGEAKTPEFWRFSLKGGRKHLWQNLLYLKNVGACKLRIYIYILLTVANDVSFPAREFMRLYLTMCSSDRCELGVYMQTLKNEFLVCPFFDQQC